MIFKPMALAEAKELYEKLKAEPSNTLVKDTMGDIWFFTDGLTRDYGAKKPTTRFRVVIAETQSYEMYVDAESEEKAKEFALDNYGELGEIFHTDAEVINIEEDAE